MWWDIRPDRTFISDPKVSRGVLIKLPSMEYRNTLTSLYCFCLLCSYVRDFYKTLCGS